MAKIFKYSLILCLIFFSIHIDAKKYALIIAVGNYDPATKWNTLSSANDIPLIKGTLLKQGFAENDITVLQDQNATKQGILSAFNNLKSRISPGDIVVIHYSGHGQQIFDDGTDEADGLDEALVPYNAHSKYDTEYKGENHLRDDEIQNIVNSFRNKLGKKGQLLMILDSCHSGNATRGAVMRGGVGALVPENWKVPSDTGKVDGSGLFETISLSNDAAPFVVISGASDSEPNYEYEGAGSLSYSFAKAMNELGSDISYRKLFSKIASTMSAIVPDQRPTIEGNIDYKIFGDEYIKQQPYFDVTTLTQGNSIMKINGGQVNQIFKNTTVLVMSSGTEQPDKNKALATGKVSYSAFADATIILDEPVKDGNAKNYWVFIDKPSYGDFSVNVFVDPKISDASLKPGISDFLNANQLGKVVDDIKDSEVVVEEKSGKYEIGYPTGTRAFAEAKPTRGNTLLNDINDKIFKFAQGNYLKNLSIKNPDYAFDFKLIPVDYDASNRKITERSENSNLNKEGILQIVPKKDNALLQITNKSDKTLYISIVEINSEGAISSFFPNKKCNLTDDERKLKPNQTQTYNNCVYSFSPPYERLILKGFASDKPLNFQSTVSTRGESNDNNNPLEKFLQHSFVKTRGSDVEEVDNDLEGFCTEVVYDIVK